jgi:hypothetical protein
MFLGTEGPARAEWGFSADTHTNAKVVIFALPFLVNFADNSM